MSLVQHELTDFLQCELFHTLGCYGVVVERLRDLDGRVSRARRRESDRLDSLFPTDVITIVRRYNEALRKSLHLPSVAPADEVPSPRHPGPQRRLDGGVVRDRWVLDFYSAAEHGLGLVARGELKPPSERNALETLGNILSIVHDPQRRGADLLMPTEGRIARTRERLLVARALFATDGDEGSERNGEQSGEEAVRKANAEKFSIEIISDCLTRGGEDHLHTHALGALVDAHICMHQAEHLMANCFGERVERRYELEREIELQLRRSLVLNTFVYVIGRATPWVFAEDEEERAFIVANYQTCCDRLYPTYCLWIGSQISLLALHRRAYTFMLLGKHAQAYNDFHKLRRFVRHLKRELGKAVAQVPGGDAFLTGLSAFADHHSGRIYRGQHAYTVALRHFERASRGLKALERESATHHVIKNSRWRIDLLLSQAKANYELGQFKHCLSCYAKAWRAFLELADTESRARANFLIVDEVIAWLEQVEDDSEIDKVEVALRLEPLVEQFRLVRGPRHLRALAAEIMMHVGHVLFILRLPRMSGETVLKRRFDSRSTDVPTSDPTEGRYPEVDHRLAHRCLLQAARLDPTSTLIAHDVLKFEFWAGVLDVDPETKKAVRPPKPVDISRQWPSGGSEFEEAARVVEYVLQRWLSATYQESGEDSPAEEQIARRLLAAFLAHTDSSNVKLAQVYRFLMEESASERGGRWGDARRAGSGHAIEFVCLRRYSSFFPFLPTPSAFPVLGGGYFVRVEMPGETPYGVVIDPGPHFVDNLYRCGYCLDDVDMIIATHDHADHIASLDALLALLGYRDIYGAPAFDNERELAIVGNESIKRRYGYFNEGPRNDYVSVWSFSEWEGGVRESPGDDEDWMSRVKRCAALRIERVETVDHTDGAGNLAQGFLLSAGDGPQRTTILFTSDTGLPPESEHRSAESGFPMSLCEAVIEADLVIAHVSSAPLAELRKLAGFDRSPRRARKQTKRFRQLWRSLVEQAVSDRAGEDLHSRRGRFLLRQLQFGFHSRPSAQQRNEAEGLYVSPLSSTSKIAKPSDRHLYISGLIRIAKRMNAVERPQVLLVGELREELGTFRTRIAGALNTDIFGDRSMKKRAFTADVGLKIRLQPLPNLEGVEARVVCTTCDMDNDLVAIERLHEPSDISEVCIKGENEGVFYNCQVHEPLVQPHPLWIERIERYEPFGH